MVLRMIGWMFERAFVETRTFQSRWADCGLNDTTDLAMLQEELATSPAAGDLMKNTGGLRKYRFKASGRGRRGGCRVIYLDIPASEYIVLITAYIKANTEKLSKAEEAAFSKLAEQIKKEVRNAIKKV